MKNNIGHTTVVAIKEDIAIRKVAGVYLIITPDNVLHRIEATSGVFILDLLQERPLTAEEVIDSVRSHFDTSGQDIERIVLDFLKDLCEKGIIDCNRRVEEKR